MRTPLVAANWKMQKTIQEALVYAADLCQRVADVHDVDIVSSRVILTFWQ